MIGFIIFDPQVYADYRLACAWFRKIYFVHGVCVCVCMCVCVCVHVCVCGCVCACVCVVRTYIRSKIIDFIIKFSIAPIASYLITCSYSWLLTLLPVIILYFLIARLCIKIKNHYSYLIVQGIENKAGG